MRDAERRANLAVHTVELNQKGLHADERPDQVTDEDDFVQMVDCGKLLSNVQPVESAALFCQERRDLYRLFSMVSQCTLSGLHAC